MKKSWMNPNWMNPKVSIWLFLFLVTSCTKFCTKSHEDLTAEEVLERYIELTFNITNVSQKDQLQVLTAGNLAAAIAGASDETFEQAYIQKKKELRSYSLVSRNDKTPRETELTYQIVYKDRSGLDKGMPASTVTTQNTVILIREKHKWFIREVVGAATTFDFPISEDSEIKAKP